jgi:hypothetical protein
MVGHGERLPWSTYSPLFHAELIECEEGPAFVNEVEIHVQQVLAARPMHDHVVAPNLVEKRAAGVHRCDRVNPGGFCMLMESMGYLTVCRYSNKRGPGGAGPRSSRNPQPNGEVMKRFVPAALAAALCVSLPAFAQTTSLPCPTKPVRVLVGFAAGYT